MKGKSILDPDFRYTKAVETDIRKTFKRARERIKKESDERASKVHQLPDMVRKTQVR